MTQNSDADGVSRREVSKLGLAASVSLVSSAYTLGSVQASQDSDAQITSPEMGATYGMSESVPVEVELSNTDTATVTVGNPEAQEFEFNVTATDTNGSGTVSFAFIPNQATGSSFGVTASDGTTVNTSEGRETSEAGFSPGAYDLVATTGGSPHYEDGVFALDRAVLNLESGSSSNEESGDESQDDSDEEGQDEADQDESSDNEDQHEADQGDSDEESQDDSDEESQDEADQDESPDDEGQDNDSEQAAGTADDDETDDAGNDDEGADDEGPGFGLGTVVAALGGAGYMLTRRGSNTGTDTQ